MTYTQNITSSGHFDAVFSNGLYRPRMESAWQRIERIRTRLRHRREISRLLALPDYLIDDVGLTRSEVRKALRRPIF